MFKQAYSTRLVRAAIAGMLTATVSMGAISGATAQPILSMSAAARSLGAQIASDITSLSSQGQSSSTISSQLAELVMAELQTGEVKPAEAVQAVVEATAGADSAFTAPILVALADRLDAQGYDASVRSLLAATIFLAEPATTDRVCAEFNDDFCAGIRSELQEDLPTADEDQAPASTNPAGGLNGLNGFATPTTDVDDRTPTSEPPGSVS